MSNTRSVLLKESSIVEAFPLISQPASNNHIYLGSPATQSFIIIEACWQPLVHLLNRPARVSFIAREIHQPLVRIKFMLLLLIHHRLIRAVDGRVIYSPTLIPAPTKMKSHTAIKRRWLGLSLGLFLGLFVLAIGVAELVPGLQPTAADFFWHPRFSLSLLTFFGASWILAVGHEYAHHIVARWFGLRSRFNLSHRLTFLVLETEYPNVYAIPRWQRIIIFGAGTTLDMAIIGLVNIGLLFSAYPDGLIAALFRQILLIQWLGLMWQCLFFMRTDLYFIIRELLGIENLYTNAVHLLTRPRHNSELLAHLSRRQRRWVTGYALFIVMGLVIGGLRYIFYHLPIVYHLFTGGVVRVHFGAFNRDWPTFTDGLVILVIQTFTVMLLAVSVLRGKLRLRFLPKFWQ